MSRCIASIDGERRPYGLSPDCPGCVVLDVGLLAQIDAAAREWGITRSASMASAAREKIMARR